MAAATTSKVLLSEFIMTGIGALKNRVALAPLTRGRSPGTFTLRISYLLTYSLLSSVYTHCNATGDLPFLACHLVLSVS